MSKLKIIWSKKIPTKSGYYLTRNNQVDRISNTHITLQDLTIQKKDKTWLHGVLYSQAYMEKFDE